ncbi:MAG: hypothetical protein AB8I08_28685 [Sandaracinaceae bacterium]
MSLLQDDPASALPGSGPLAVLAAEGAPGVFSAAVIALAWAERRPTRLFVKDDDAGAIAQPIPPGADSWAAAMAEWWAEQTPAVDVLGWDGATLDRTALGLECVVVAGTAGLLEMTRPPCDRVAVLGVPESLDAQLAAEVGLGSVRAVEVIPRFGPVGRLFIEMVEHVHHRVGPMAQSTAADVLRASLFGRHGRIPVNLATRETPRAVGPAQTLVWWFDPDTMR